MHKITEKQKLVLQYVSISSLKNSRRFLDDACLLIEDDSFSHAFALIILAIEEMGKAVYCNWAKNGYVEIDKKFLKNIRNHRIKLNVLMEVERLTVLQNEINKYSSKDGNILLGLKPDGLDVLQKIENIPDFISIKEFYSKLDKLKQSSLYVDIKDGFIPLSPDLITKEVSDFYLKFAQLRLSAVTNAFL